MVFEPVERVDDDQIRFTDEELSRRAQLMGIDVARFHQEEREDILREVKETARALVEALASRKGKGSRSNRPVVCHEICVGKVSLVEMAAEITRRSGHYTSPGTLASNLCRGLKCQGFTVHYADEADGGRRHEQRRISYAARRHY